MSRKPDLPFIIFLVIVIAGGIYLLKLTKQRSGLRRENERLIGVLSRFPAEKVCICLSGEPTTVLKSLFDSLNYEVKICPVLRVKAFFYVNTVGQTKGYFVLNQFSLGLLDKYLKLLRENYLYP